MVLSEVGLQGRAELYRSCSRRTERVVEGPLIREPRALVRHTFQGVLELCHRSRGNGYPRPRRECRSDGDQGGRRCLG